MKPYKILLVACVSAVWLMAACSDNDCSLTNTAYAHFEFVSHNGQPVKMTSPVDVTGFIVRADTLANMDLFNDATTFVSLPMSYSAQTTYVMHYTETIRDTIVLAHRCIPHVADIACGTFMFFEVENISYTTNALDSIKLVNPDITNEEKVNFLIYYTVDE